MNTPWRLLICECCQKLNSSGWSLNSEFLNTKNDLRLRNKNPVQIISMHKKSEVKCAVLVSWEQSDSCLIAAQLSPTTEPNSELWLQPTSPRRATTASLHIPGNAASWRQQIHQRGGDINNVSYFESCNNVYCLTKCISSPLLSEQRRYFSMQYRGGCWCHRSVYRGLSHRLERLFGQCRCQTHCLSGITIQFSRYKTPSGSSIAEV